jgi:hypothetical protein
MMWRSGVASPAQSATRNGTAAVIAAFTVPRLKEAAVQRVHRVAPLLLVR